VEKSPRPLDGVPFLVKDDLNTKGLRTTFVSRLMESNVPGENAICVDLLANDGMTLTARDQGRAGGAEPISLAHSTIWWGRRAGGGHP